MESDGGWNGMAGKGRKKTANMEELADQWIGLRETLQDRSIYFMIIMGNSMVSGFDFP
jgi:hypothetical protein